MWNATNLPHSQYSQALSAFYSNALNEITAQNSRNINPFGINPMNTLTNPVFNNTQPNNYVQPIPIPVPIFQSKTKQKKTKKKPKHNENQSDEQDHILDKINTRFDEFIDKLEQTNDDIKRINKKININTDDPNSTTLLPTEINKKSHQKHYNTRGRQRVALKNLPKSNKHKQKKVRKKLKQEIIWNVFNEDGCNVQKINKGINDKRDECNKIKLDSKQLYKTFEYYSKYCKVHGQGFTLKEEYRRNLDNDMAMHLREKFGPFKWEMEQSDDETEESDDESDVYSDYDPTTNDNIHKKNILKRKRKEKTQLDIQPPKKKQKLDANTQQLIKYLKDNDITMDDLKNINNKPHQQQMPINNIPQQPAQPAPIPIITNQRNASVATVNTNNPS